jgi:peptidoglycan/LPS O-acetylase OafA/YrhL
MHRQFPAFRGIAIILVVLNHSIHMGTKYSLESMFAPVIGWAGHLLDALLMLGFFAVPIFLFLSGSFFAYAAAKKNIRSSYKVVQKTLPFILFPYLIWSLIFYFEIFALHNQPVNLVEWLRNLVIGYPFNFVPLLIFFYLVGPILVILGKRLGWVLILLIAIYQLALINILRPGVLGFQFPAWFDIIALPVLKNPLADWAIFFPLGLVYVLKMEKTLPLLRRFKWGLIAVLVVLYVLSVLNATGTVNMPIARYIAPVLLMLVMPTIPRNSIPQVRTLEELGKRAYGLYLMNLLVLDLMLFAIQQFTPGLLGYPLMVIPFLFVFTFIIPITIMKWVERLPNPFIYRYVFG